MQINDRFGAAAAIETVSLPDGTEAAVPTEHAAALNVNEQSAIRVECTPELLPQLAEQTPMGRLGTPADIAAAVAFLASPEADFITGQVLSPNGGFVI